MPPAIPVKQKDIPKLDAMRSYGRLGRERERGEWIGIRMRERERERRALTHCTDIAEELSLIEHQSLKVQSPIPSYLPISLSVLV